MGRRIIYSSAMNLWLWFVEISVVFYMTAGLQATEIPKLSQPPPFSGTIDLSLMTSEKLGNCFFRVLDFEGNFTYRYDGLQNPRIIHFVPYNVTVQLRLRMFGGVEKVPLPLRHLVCIIHVVTMHDRWIHYTNGEQEFSLPQKSMTNAIPEIWVVFTGSVAISPQTVRDLYDEPFCQKIFCSGTTPIFWVPQAMTAPSGSLNNSSTALEAFLVCWYCISEDMVYVPIKMKDGLVLEDMLKAYEMTTGNGESIEWRADFSYRHMKPHPSCPVTFGQKLQCPQADPLVVQHFLQAYVNVTTGNTASCHSFRLKIQYRIALSPYICFMSLNGMENNYWRIQYLPTGSTVQLRFMTSSGIAEDDARHWFTPLTVAFQPAVCLGTAIGIIFIAFTVSLLQQGCLNSPSKLMWNAISVSSILLEKDGTIKIVGNDGKVRGRILLGTWLAAALILTNAYRGITKSNYVFEPEHTTELHGLRDLQNFTLYVSSTLFPAGSYSGLLNLQDWWRDGCSGELEDFYHKPLVSFTDCKATKLYESCVRDFGRNSYKLYFCDIVQRHYHYMKDISPEEFCRHNYCAPAYAAWYEEYQKDAFNFFRHIRILGSTSIEDALLEQLSNPRTAYVSSKQAIRYEWDRVRRTLKGSSLRFAHNQHIQDDFLGWTVGYKISGVFEKLQVNKPLKVIIALMQSGIHGWWVRWGQLREEFREGRKVAAAAGHEGYMTLSFESSDVGLVFWLFSYCTAVAIVTFLLQFVHLGLHYAIRSLRQLMR